ncbi:MAG: (4Fe-4S)-binding protein [Cytophagaceae bacterium]|nr:(4Fe-4S)-binding protein [Cytophagaceae bacterium]
MKEYTNKEITIVWDDTKCCHSGNCVKGLSKVFNPRARPWVNIHAAGSEEIMKAIDRCPSKALTYRKN